MKTAEQWFKEIIPYSYQNSMDLLVLDIKQIQLDAWKQGMTDADTIISNIAHDELVPIQLEILRVRDNRKNI